jgi:integrase
MPANLTDRALRALKPNPDGSQREVFDADARGLSARCSTSGAISFCFTYTSPLTKKRRRKTIGTYPAWQLADARVEALALRQAVETGRDPIDEEAADAGRMTVAQLVDRYLAVIEKTHRDHCKVRRSIERDVIPAIGTRTTEDIRRRDIIAILDTIAGRGAPVHANRVRNMLSSMWSWAISEDLPGIENNPASNIKGRIVEQPGTRWLSVDEIRSAMPHIEALPAAKRDALRLILLTGQRPGEVVGMRAREIDLSRDIWTIPAERAKNKRQHVVPLVGEARAIVARLMSDARAEELERHDGLLLLVRARGVRPLLVNNLNASLRTALASSGVEIAKPHDLRRSALTHLGRLGIDPLIIGHVANHVSTTRNTVTTSVYVRHDYLAEKQDALTKWDAAMARIAAGEDLQVERANVVLLRA